MQILPEDYLNEIENAYVRGFKRGYMAAIAHAISQIADLEVEEPHGKPE